MNTNVWVALAATVAVVGGMWFVAPETVAWIALGLAALGWIAWGVWDYMRDRGPRP
jgi:type VI protein secretion system component VasK